MFYFILLILIIQQKGMPKCVYLPPNGSKFGRTCGEECLAGEIYCESHAESLFPRSSGVGGLPALMPLPVLTPLPALSTGGSPPLSLGGKAAIARLNKNPVVLLPTIPVQGTVPRTSSFISQGFGSSPPRSSPPRSSPPRSSPPRSSPPRSSPPVLSCPMSLRPLTRSRTPSPVSHTTGMSPKSTYSSTQQEQFDEEQFDEEQFDEEPCSLCFEDQKSEKCSECQYGVCKSCLSKIDNCPGCRGQDTFDLDDLQVAAKIQRDEDLQQRKDIAGLVNGYLLQEDIEIENFYTIQTQLELGIDLREQLLLIIDGILQPDIEILSLIKEIVMEKESFWDVRNFLFPFFDLYYPDMESSTLTLLSNILREFIKFDVNIMFQ
jgi:hypothetical protein